GLTGYGGINGHPEYLRNCLETSLKHLDTDYIDIFFLHRIDHNVPIHDSLGSIQRLIEEGKVRFGGISEVCKKDLLHISNNQAVSCVQYCLNFFESSTFYSVLPILKQRNYGLATYSPFSSGWFLKEKYKSLTINKMPFFNKGFYRPHFTIYKALMQLVKHYNITMSELALFWVLNHSDIHTTIFGTSSLFQLVENLKVLQTKVPLTVMKEINKILEIGSKQKNILRNIICNIGLKVTKLIR
ncbi:MAG: aldo/keto reductase, partial [Nitrospinae bacterium]|nr:aldo/keto reductase [Nitrospinota bacterium]